MMYVIGIVRAKPRLQLIARGRGYEISIHVDPANLH